MKLWRAILFLTGIALLFAVWLPPFSTLANQYSITFHVLRQLALVLGAPLLLVKGSRDLLKPLSSKHARIAPWIAWAIGIIALWIVYLPPVFNAMAASRDLRLAVEVLLPAAGVLFWWPAFSPIEEARMSPIPKGMLFFFAACVATSILGLYIMFDRSEAFYVYINPRDSMGILHTLRDQWALTPELDQETAGLLMWIGTCMFFLMSVMMMFYRWYTSSAVKNEFAPPPNPGEADERAAEET